MPRPAASNSARFIHSLPALTVRAREALWRAPDGTIERLSLGDAARKVARGAAPLVCHAPAVFRRLDIKPCPTFDVLELFAFAHPARFCVPTAPGLAVALGLGAAGAAEEAPALLPRAAEELLAVLAETRGDIGNAAGPVALAMAAAGWSWGPSVLEALGEEDGEFAARRSAAGLEAWRRLPEWAERAPEPPPGLEPVTAEEAISRLQDLRGPEAERRTEQDEYAGGLVPAFAPPDREGEPKLVLAEAGTGVGKTLGYLAPASVWADKNEGAVWISTYTRNLQHQIDQELDRLYPDPVRKRQQVVVRKGRENYLCLLNYEDAVGAARLRSQDALGLGLIARWVGATKDGALTGGDFPGWLADLVGRRLAANLTDRRGECIYSNCRHYGRCFIEHSTRRARRARVVVANHALVMVQATLAGTGGGGDRALPTRYVFDEGHHLFAAADSAYSAHLSGLESAELRRWLRGAETSDTRRSRARGLRARLSDLLLDDARAEEATAKALAAAKALPGDGWQRRLADGFPEGVAERFLSLVRQQVDARERNYGLETMTSDPVPGLTEAGAELRAALAEIQRPLARLREQLVALLDDEAETMETATRNRVEALVRSIERRAILPLAGWGDMLDSLSRETPEQFVDWLSVDRDFGRDVDVGMHRHWIDPTIPFAETMAATAHGFVVTSATLRDGTGDEAHDWDAAEVRTGERHIPGSSHRVAVASPFDYAGQTRLFVVTDVDGRNMDRLAAAYRALFLASAGGALGLFTAISRLRAVQERLAPAMDQAEIPLLAQHVDGYDVSTLVDIFRAERRSCLLGTDAVRDGVDVPGDALRLIVFDKVPWPRPDILHKARRAAFGARGYDDMLTRLRLKQAFGRLVRRATDRGVFVMLDSRLPTRLTGAFPAGVEVQRVGLADAVRGVREFLGQASADVVDDHDGGKRDERQ